MPGRKYASACSSALPPLRAAIVTKSHPIPMPTRAFTTNCTVLRWTRRTTSSRTAAATLTPSASWSSRVESHTIVNSSVGTAASIMPRRPPSALLSWARTTDSTVSTDGAGASVVGSLTV
jgi:hypothetical protein